MVEQVPLYLAPNLKCPSVHSRLVGGKPLRTWGAYGGPIFNYEPPLGATKGITGDMLVHLPLKGVFFPQFEIGHSGSFCPVSGRFCYYTVLKEAPSFRTVVDMDIIDFFSPA